MSEPLSDILIFGAGFGTRMTPLTDHLPKPLVPVAGRPLVDHALELAKGLTPHVNLHYRAAQLQAHLPQTVVTHLEQPEILDTGGGLKNALPDMEGDAVFTLNSDTVWAGPNPLEALISAWRPDMDALLLLIPMPQTVGYTRAGNFAIDPSGRLTRDDSGQVYSGAQIIKRSAVEDWPDDAFSLNAIWDQLLERETAFGTSYTGHWADVGTPDGIALAEAMLADV